MWVARRPTMGVDDDALVPNTLNIELS